MSAIATILHERARRHHWQGYGPLSIKAFFAGQAHYTVGGARYLVDGTSYLVLNEGQEYTVEIAGATPVESFCVFFAPGLAEDVLRALTAPASALLDAPEAAPSGALAFFERTYPHDGAVSPVLRRLRAAHAAHAAHAAYDPETGWVAEQYHLLLEGLLRAQARVRGEVELLPAARAGTREELYRRLWVARDYAAALADTPVSLEDLARVACMSPNHLLRTFKAAFGQTPHQFLTERRIERACTLLRTTRLPITEICLAVGFHSLGTFSALFRQRVGVSPAGYRRDAGAIG